MGIVRINGLLLKKLLIGGANELNRNRAKIDALNVFPVPDGDTGTNMSLTMLAAARELEKTNDNDISTVAKLVANGALRAARGNSGVITSQLFRGFAKALTGVTSAGTKELATALRQGVKTAYTAVMKPKEGTILTVAASCATNAERMAQQTEDIELFLSEIIKGAKQTLLQTTDMLPQLKQAGVVDAGGKGLLCILEGALKSLKVAGEVVLEEFDRSENQDFSNLASVETTEITFGYCTEFFIDLPNPTVAAVNRFQAYLATMGDCVICVSGEDVLKIHIHTDRPGTVLDKAMEIGPLKGIKIDNMRVQHTNIIDFSKNGGQAQAAASTKQTPQTPPAMEQVQAVAATKEIGFVSISAGDGFLKIFKNLGVDEVIEGGQTMNPSTEDILQAVEKVNAKNVIVLPNNKNIILAAQQCAKLALDKDVFVVPTKSVPEGIAAMVSYGGSAKEIESLLSSMKESASLVGTASVTYAVRESSANHKLIQTGDILGILENEIAVISKSVQKGAKELIDLAVSSHSEMITVYYGADISPRLAQEIKEYLEQKYPHCESELQYGGQPLYYYIISVE